MPKDSLEIALLSTSGDYVIRRECRSDPGSGSPHHYLAVSTRDDRPWKMRVVDIFNDPGTSLETIDLAAPEVDYWHHEHEAKVEYGPCKRWSVERVSVPAQGTRFIAVVAREKAGVWTVRRPSLYGVWDVDHGKLQLHGWNAASEAWVKALGSAFGRPR